MVLAMDTQQVTHQDKIWPAFCELKAWLMAYLSYCQVVSYIRLWNIDCLLYCVCFGENCPYHYYFFFILLLMEAKSLPQESLLSFEQMNYGSTKINSPNISLLDQFVGKTHCLTFHSKYFCWFSITPKGSNPSIPLVDGCNRDVSFERPWSI